MPCDALSRLIERFEWVLCVALAVALCAGTSKAEHEPLGSSSILRAKIGASAFFAGLDGELQTPSGGARGTTSAQRPTTREVGLGGLEPMLLGDLSLRFFEQHTLHMSYVALAQKGRATLARPLVSQAQTFPERARVKSRLEMPIGRIGYRAHWLALSLGRWSLEPEIGAARIDFRYRLQSNAATGPVDRAYEIYFAYWGLQLQRPILSRLRGEIDLFASAGISNVVSLDSDFRLVYRVAQNDLFTASLVLGLRGIWLHYKDNQKEEQNDINLRAGAFSSRPWAGLHFGLQLAL